MPSQASSITDEAAMTRALTLAERGWGRVHPNPLVGAVIVRDGAIIAEGWHARYGAQHAEVVALGQAGAQARGATLYLTLEPCAHHGKQPPCVDAILAAGITRVVVALADPNPVATGGAIRLQAAGVAVELGLKGEDAARLNARFIHRFGSATRPFTAAKLAVSLDGRISDAAGCSQWISGPDARAFVHYLRAGFGAIGIGARSLIADNAKLTVRGEIVPAPPPIRVVFDHSASVPFDQGIFADADRVPVWMVVGTATADNVVAGFESRGAKVISADTLPEALATLAIRGVDSLLVEGGGRLAGALLGAGLLDRVYQVQSPVWLGDGRPAWAGLGTPALSDATRWRSVERRALGEDTLLVLEP